MKCFGYRCIVGQHKLSLGRVVVVLQTGGAECKRSGSCSFWLALCLRLGFGNTEAFVLPDRLTHLVFVAGRRSGCTRQSTDIAKTLHLTATIAVGFAVGITTSLDTCLPGRTIRVVCTVGITGRCRLTFLDTTSFVAGLIVEASFRELPAGMTEGDRVIGIDDVGLTGRVTLWSFGNGRCTTTGLTAEIFSTKTSQTNKTVG